MSLYSICLFRAGKLTIGLEKGTEALKLSEETNISLEQKAIILETLGNISSILGNKKEAINYYMRTLELNNKLNDPKRKTPVLNSLAVSYLKFGELDKAENVLLEILQYFLLRQILLGKVLYLLLEKLLSSKYNNFQVF